MIHARGLGKDFVSTRKQPGFLGSVRSFLSPERVVKPAVSGFDVDVEPGEFVGLLGPNGAGKTTLMKMFTGIVVPSHGELEVLGCRPWDRPEAFRRRIALVMGQKSQLWWDIPARDSLELLRRYYDLEDDEFLPRLDELADLLEVRDLLHVHLRRLSLGERMKMELIACLLHAPDLIFLDEPTIGLDLVAQVRIRAFLREWRERHGTTVILTSHYMADVAALCERIVLLLGGTKRFDGPLEEFEKVLGAERVVRFRFAEPPGEHALFAGYHPRTSSDGLRVELRIPEGEIRGVTARILEALPVTDFASEEMPIERVMSELMNNPALAEAPGAEA